MYKEDLSLNNLQWLICHKPDQIHLITKKPHHYFNNLLGIDAFNLCQNKIYC